MRCNHRDETPYVASTPQRTKRRLSEKRHIEQHYRGPLNVEPSENPFHCRGAGEYISQRQYEVCLGCFRLSVHVRLFPPAQHKMHCCQQHALLLTRIRGPPLLVADAVRQHDTAGPGRPGD